MSAPIPRVEQGGVKEFTVSYSAAPGVAPYLTISAGSGAGSLVHSVTGTASTATLFAAHVTMPGSPQLLAYTWVASFTAGPVVIAGHVHVIRTWPG